MKMKRKYLQRKCAASLSRPIMMREAPQICKSKSEAWLAAYAHIRLESFLLRVRSESLW